MAQFHHNNNNNNNSNNDYKLFRNHLLWKNGGQIVSTPFLYKPLVDLFEKDIL